MFPRKCNDLIDLGLPEEVIIFNESLNIGAKSLFSFVQKRFFDPPMGIMSKAYSVEDAILVNGTFWQYTANQFADAQLSIDAILWENQDGRKIMRMDKVTVGYVYAFNVSDRDNQAQVKIVSCYKHREICGFFIGLVADILDHVCAWEGGRSASWRKETQNRIFAQQMQSDPLQVVGETQPILSEPTANQTPTTQPPAPTDAPKKKRLLGLRVDYLIIGIILGVLISGVSFLLFPDWARSLTLVILFPYLLTTF